MLFSRKAITNPRRNKQLDTIKYLNDKKYLNINYLSSLSQWTKIYYILLNALIVEHIVNYSSAKLTIEKSEVVLTRRVDFFYQKPLQAMGNKADLKE